jgi:hypothetical protein
VGGGRVVYFCCELISSSDVFLIWEPDTKGENKYFDSVTIFRAENSPELITSKSVILGLDSLLLVDKELSLNKIFSDAMEYGLSA